MSNYVGITMGDPAGVGPEISLKVLCNHPEFLNKTIIYGSMGVLQYYHEKFNVTIPLHKINEPKEFKEGVINVIDVLPLSFADFNAGEVSAVAGNAAYQYVETAITAAMARDINAVITAPLNKDALHKGGHNYEGHTEIFATLTGSKKYSMLLWCEKMSVVHVSTHCSIAEAVHRVTKARVFECIQLADDAMKQMGIAKPRIAVAGLNPHSGEGGLFGREEITEIEPAILEAQEKGFDVTGPVPPDTVFMKAMKGQFDVVVAMYYDQGHIPMKVVAFDDGVNTTLGLPIIRTSVDHGTAFDIAGQGVANDTSMYWALYVADKMVAQRFGDK